MPHFTDDGRDTYICQVCACIKADTPTWRPDITGHKGAGNVCPSCLAKHNAAATVARSHQQPAPINYSPREPISLYEHCRIESGLTGRALDAYINRHYGNS